MKTYNEADAAIAEAREYLRILRLAQIANEINLKAVRKSRAPRMARAIVRACGKHGK